MKVKIWTNEVEGGWSPYDLETFLGGSEEAIVLFAEALVRMGFSVTVYHTKKYEDPKPDETTEKNGVVYKNRALGEMLTGDIFITWKDNTPWIEGGKCYKKIHWSSDVESPWDTSLVDHFIHLTNFHETRNLFVESGKSKIFPQGVDLKSLDKNKTEKVQNTMLYCSSPDRGLFNLLKDWPQIKTHFPELELKITYGFELFEKIMGEKGEDFKNMIMSSCNQPGITWLGQLSKDEIEKEYWKAQYWVMPLQKPQSELFCLNALKTRHTGCIPVVNKIGALRDTVGDFIDYKAFVNGSKKITRFESKVSVLTWVDVVKQYWMPLFEGGI